jgi:alkanesulfonate monooxygenase SsuD/methylene tetrahydromethanopterin reductase-like flavin-dependent oxidoreductase (luciferase family)
MKVGLGLPTSFPSDEGHLVMEWAKRAEKAGFSAISLLDRLVYDNFDPLITLTAAAAVTERIRLMTAILIVPLHGAGILAKEAASLDALANGRLTLGVAIGNRKDDFLLAGTKHSDRGRRFDEQLGLMKRIWAGDDAGDGVGPVGPAPIQPGGPPLIFGGRSEIALRRVAQWGEGYVTGSVSDVAGARKTYEIAERVWREAGRAGNPLFIGSLACAIGEAEAQATNNAIQHYYSYQGGRPANGPGQPGSSPAANASSVPSTGAAIQELLKKCEAAGMDEVFVRPAGVTDPDQVDRLAEALL